MQTSIFDSTATEKPLGWVRAAFLTGLLAGTLDFAAAAIQYVLLAHKSPVNVLNFIASGVFGKAAFAGGSGMALAGLALHYLIAVLFALAFYWLAAHWLRLRRHPGLAGVGYGMLVWLVMNLVVVPGSQAPQLPFKPLSAAIGLGILVLCIGLPIALRAARFYTRPSASSPA
jgi:uncharacterized membrane protein YagU involved in acid resistance